jgi:hypothetical protein
VNVLDFFLITGIGGSATGVADDSIWVLQREAGQTQ